jgi:uncharacterized protein (TIGR03083 family)
VSTDYASAYHDLRTRVSDLLRSIEPAALDTIAPATPEWRVRDVLAHITGVCDDIATGNMAGVATDDWTAAQVTKRRAWTLVQMLDDWDAHATTLEGVMNDLGPRIGQLLADAATHEQDIRGALDAPGGREAPALVIGVDWGLGTLGDRMTREGRGTLRVDHEGGTSELGAGDPCTGLRSTRFELGRAMTGRRSRAQMRAMDWDGALDPETLILDTNLFAPPERDLIE